MTPRQQAAQRAWELAHEAHRIAIRGDRERTNKRLTAAAIEVLEADNEANRLMRRERLCAQVGV